MIRSENPTRTRSLLGIAAVVVGGFVSLLLAAFVLHLALLSSSQFNWIDAPEPELGGPAQH